MPQGFRRLGGKVAPRRHHVELLVGVINLDVLRKTAPKHLAEVLLNAPANDENKLPEAGPLRVENCVVKHRLAAGSDRFHLFQSAVAGADAGGQNN